MPDYSAQVPYVAAPVLALLLVFWTRRWRWAGALAIGMLAVGIGAWKKVIFVTDVGTLLTHGGLAEALSQLFLWTLYAILLRTHGRIPLRGHPMWLAPLMGALLGELAAAALLSSGARDPKAAARLALAAAGGAMIGRIGDPAILVMWSSDLSPVFLGLVGLGCVAVASPQVDDLETDDADSLDPLLLGGVIAVAVLGMARELALEGLAVGCGLMLYQLRSRALSADLRPLGWLVGSVLVVLVATAGGVFSLGGQGLEELWSITGERTRLILSGGAVVLSALCGEQAASLVTEGLLLRSPGLQIADLHTSMAAGLAVGGLGPLVVAGALKHGLLRWAAQVVLVLGFCALFLG